MVDSKELDNVGMPESTKYRAFFLEATSGVSYSLLVESLVELLGCAREALVLDCVDGSVGASSQFISSLSYSLECVLLQSCCLIRFSSLRHNLYSDRDSDHISEYGRGLWAWLGRGYLLHIQEKKG